MFSSLCHDAWRVCEKIVHVVWKHKFFTNFFYFFWMSKSEAGCEVILFCLLLWGGLWNVFVLSLAMALLAKEAAGKLFLWWHYVVQHQPQQVATWIVKVEQKMSIPVLAVISCCLHSDSSTPSISLHRSTKQWLIPDSSAWAAHAAPNLTRLTLILDCTGSSFTCWAGVQVTMRLWALPAQEFQQSVGLAVSASLWASILSPHLQICVSTQNSSSLFFSCGSVSWRRSWFFCSNIPSATQEMCW